METTTVVRDVLNITVDECLALIAEWAVLRTSIEKFLRNREVPYALFFDALRNNKLMDHYFQVREQWQTETDAEMVQESIVTILKAVRDGDVETSKWVVERRAPFFYAPAETQLKLAQALKAGGPNNRNADALDPKIIGAGNATEP
jgi:hypothetical protein